MPLPKATPLLLLFLFGGKSKKSTPKPVVTVYPGTFDGPGGQEPPKGSDPPDIQDPVSPVAVWGQMMRPSPTPGFGYTVKQGDVLLGSGGLIAQALKKVQPGTPSPAARQAYYEATTRVRTNWVLYATGDDGSQRVWVENPAGEKTSGNITAALLPVNDSWMASMSAGEMPRRLIKFSRQLQGDKKVPVPIAGWQSALHGGARTYGTILFPPLACIGLGPTGINNGSCDWRSELWSAVGVERATFGG